jgi:hypothetical protein
MSWSASCSGNAAFVKENITPQFDSAANSLTVTEEREACIFAKAAVLSQVAFYEKHAPDTVILASAGGSASIVDPGADWKSYITFSASVAALPPSLQ